MKSRVEGLKIFNHTSGTWSQTSLASVNVTYDPVVRKVFILGMEFTFDGYDDFEATLRSVIRDEDGHQVLLRIPAKSYEGIMVFLVAPGDGDIQ